MPEPCWSIGEIRINRPKMLCASICARLAQFLNQSLMLRSLAIRVMVYARRLHAEAHICELVPENEAARAMAEGRANYQEARMMEEITNAP